MVTGTIFLCFGGMQWGGGQWGQKRCNELFIQRPACYYQHYPADEGKQYVDLCFAYKNLGSSAIGADKVLTGNLLYCDRY